jgi:hypothetical protein
MREAFKKGYVEGKIDESGGDSDKHLVLPPTHPWYIVP